MTLLEFVDALELDLTEFVRFARYTNQRHNLDALATVVDADQFIELMGAGVGTYIRFPGTNVIEAMCDGLKLLRLFRDWRAKRSADTDTRALSERALWAHAKKMKGLFKPHETNEAVRWGRIVDRVKAIEADMQAAKLWEQKNKDFDARTREDLPLEFCSYSPHTVKQPRQAGRRMKRKD